jgi:hypothetical protein
MTVPEIDTGPWKAAIADLEALLALAPLDTAEIIRSDLFGLPDCHKALSKLVRHVSAASTGEHRLALEPSDLFVRILTAFRAGQWEYISFIHEISPVEDSPMGDEIEITAEMTRAGWLALCSFPPSSDPYDAGEAIVESVFRAMAEVQVRSKYETPIVLQRQRGI